MSPRNIGVYRFLDACNKTSSLTTCCGLHAFDKETHFCCGGVPIEFPFRLIECVVEPPAYSWPTQTCVSGLSIDLPMSICQDGNMHVCCGGLIADTPVKACVPGLLHSDGKCCGLIPYNLKHQRCCGRHTGMIYTRDVHWLIIMLKAGSGCMPNEITQWW